MSMRRLLPLWVLPFALSACSRPAAAPAAPAPSGAPPKVTGTGVVAEVNGGAILSSELEQRVSGRLARVRQEEYDIRRQVLDEMIAERLVAAEAAKRKISAEALLKQEVDGKAATPEDSYVDSIYEQNKLRFAGSTKTEATARIREILRQRAIADRRTAFEKDLRAGATVAVRLEAPRTAVAIPSGAPSTGPKEAPVTIVEFTDYQCPYCHSAQSTIDQVMSRYEGQVRLVHLDFPLDFHSEAVPAARAARCAGEQGKFWEYHHSLMTQKGTLDTEDLKQRATSLKLAETAFGSCLGSKKHDPAIQAELKQGTELGVTGTPAYFVNGRMLSGAHPLESFTEVIDAELDTAKAGAGGERR